MSHSQAVRRAGLEMATAINMAMLILVRVAAIAERAIVGHSVGRSHYRYWGSGLWRPAKGSQDHQGKRRRRFRTDLARLLVAKVVIRVCNDGVLLWAAETYEPGIQHHGTGVTAPVKRDDYRADGVSAAGGKRY